MKRHQGHMWTTGLVAQLVIYGERHEETLDARRRNHCEIRESTLRGFSLRDSIIILSAL